MRSFFPLFFFVVSLGLAGLPLGCASQKVALESYQGNQIAWGNGGGVSGRVTEYVLLPTGQVFQRDPLSRQAKELSAISGKEAEKLFEQASALELSFRHPGNLYQYIKLADATGLQKEAVWGSNQFTAPPQVQALYRQLQALVKK
ncbi:hypothetical protein [Rufibacter psychrotolerans]|uniref:hypothetical protein n=1 Tax=Rufibacter psychrotolerans TaxID=2812556 RepID=UPI001968513A|nr:hypothetical protein [Rufibacter sp. SYSU D00308]